MSSTKRPDHYDTSLASDPVGLAAVASKPTRKVIGVDGTWQDKAIECPVCEAVAGEACKPDKHPERVAAKPISSDELRAMTQPQQLDGDAQAPAPLDKLEQVAQILGDVRQTLRDIHALLLAAHETIGTIDTSPPPAPADPAP